MSKIIYKTTLNRYVVSRVVESSWIGGVIRYEAVDSFGERADAIAEADELQREWPDEQYVVIDSEAEDADADSE
jgi:hypothetical protein